MRPVAEHRLVSDEETAQLLVGRTREAENPDEFPEGTDEALHHLGGYLAYSVQKTHKCSACVAVLAQVQGESPDGAQPTSQDCSEGQSCIKGFTELMNRGRLMYPSELCVQLVREICLLYRTVTEDENRNILFETSCPRRVFQGVVAKRLKERDDFRHVICEEGHVLVEQTLYSMSGSLFNAFTANYVKEVNSEIHASKHGDLLLARPGTRSKSSTKIRQLTGGK